MSKGWEGKGGQWVVLERSVLDAPHQKLSIYFQEAQELTFLTAFPPRSLVQLLIGMLINTLTWRKQSHICILSALPVRSKLIE